MTVINYTWTDVIQVFILTFVVCSPLFIDLYVKCLDNMRQREVAKRHLSEFIEEVNKGYKRGNIK